MDAHELPPLLGESDSFLEAVEAASQLAALDRPALIIGERGTGKELIAARIHYLSPRWTGPLVKVNCAALSEELLDAELFGHVPGAFTGATRSRAGRFEIADGGSLFLDEVGTMSPRLQEKLLRIIEYGAFEPLGSSETREVSVRIIGATNDDLPALVEAGYFRGDLMDRLSFDVVTLPPLRARPDDILLLAEHFARAMTLELGREAFAGFTDAARRQMQAHDWPGNVRELRNAVERAIYRQLDADKPVAALVLDPFASPYRPQKSQAAAPTGASALRYPFALTRELEAMERRWLKQALKDHQYNQRRCAEALELSYDQLRNRLRKYRLLDSGHSV